MTYSGPMTQPTDSGITVGAIVNGAPDFNLNYPSSGRIIGPAWSFMWDLLAQSATLHPETFLDGRLLAEDAAKHVAAKLGIDSVGVETCAHLLRRAARTQVPILESEIRTVQGNRGTRPRAFYRLSADARERYLGA